VADDVLVQVDKVVLERLRLGSRVEVPAGTTGIREMMSDISVVTGNEVALVRDKSVLVGLPREVQTNSFCHPIPYA
jgi:hypothetical protein